jgi:hypothetical protein
MLLEINKSRIFILPFYELATEPFNIVNTYLSNKEYYGTEDIADYFYVELKSWNPNFKNKYYVNHYHTEHNTVMLVLMVPDELKKIRDKFIEGKYSEFDEAYIERFFNRNYAVVGHNTNYRILKKDNVELTKNIMPLREYWKVILDTELPENAELLSKPNLRKETYDNARFEYDINLIPHELIPYVNYKLETLTDKMLEDLSSSKKQLKSKLEKLLVPTSVVHTIATILLENKFKRKC